MDFSSGSKCSKSLVFLAITFMIVENVLSAIDVLPKPDFNFGTDQEVCKARTIGALHRDHLNRKIKVKGEYMDENGEIFPMEAGLLIDFGGEVAFEGEFSTYIPAEADVLGKRVKWLVAISRYNILHDLESQKQLKKNIEEFGKTQQTWKKEFMMNGIRYIEFAGYHHTVDKTYSEDGYTRNYFIVATERLGVNIDLEVSTKNRKANARASAAVGQKHPSEVKFDDTSSTCSTYSSYSTKNSISSDKRPLPSIGSDSHTASCRLPFPSITSIKKAFKSLFPVRERKTVIPADPQETDPSLYGLTLKQIKIHDNKNKKEIAAIEKKRRGQTKRKLRPLVLLNMFKRMVSIFLYLHKRKIVHGCVTPRNILYENGQFYLINFISARAIDDWRVIGCFCDVRYEYEAKKTSGKADASRLSDFYGLFVIILEKLGRYIPWMRISKTEAVGKTESFSYMVGWSMSFWNLKKLMRLPSVLPDVLKLQTPLLTLWELAQIAAADGQPEGDWDSYQKMIVFIDVTIRAL